MVSNPKVIIYIAKTLSIGIASKYLLPPYIRITSLAKTKHTYSTGKRTIKYILEILSNKPLYSS